MTDDRSEERVPAPTHGAEMPSPGAPWRLILALVLAVLLVVFAVQNTQAVNLRFLGWDGEFPLVIIIVAVAVATIVLDEVVGLVIRRRRRRRAGDRAELKRLRQAK